MAIRYDDGQYALDCWRDENDKNEPSTEYSDNQLELRERAELLLKAGRFNYLVLSRWNPDTKPDGDWDELAVFEN